MHRKSPDGKIGGDVHDRVRHPKGSVVDTFRRERFVPKTRDWCALKNRHDDEGHAGESGEGNTDVTTPAEVLCDAEDSEVEALDGDFAKEDYHFVEYLSGVEPLRF